MQFCTAALLFLREQHQRQQALHSLTHRLDAGLSAEVALKFEACDLNFSPTGL